MAGLGRPLNWCVYFALSWGLLVASPAPLLAQFRNQFQMTPQQRTPEESLLERLPREPALQIQVRNAEEYVQAQDYEAAIDTLQSILEESEDFFEVEGGKPTGSALDRVEQLLRGIPPEARETYRRRYEPLAAQRLSAATASGNLAEMLAVVRIYPLTESALQATRLAGETAFDQGETALAARLWERLLRETEAGAERTSLLIRIARAWTLAGQPESAADQVRELSELAQTSPLKYEGKLLTPPSTGDAAWLNKVFGPVAPLIPQRSGDWRIGGGHPRRWGNGTFVSSLQRGSWVYPLIDEFDVYEAGRNDHFQTMLKEVEQKYLSKGRSSNLKTPPLVIGAPIVVGDTVLIQGLGAVKALDARTGEIRWSGVVRDDTFLYWTQRNYTDKGANPTHDRLVELFLGQRSWINQTGAWLASDGQLVYSVTSTGMIGANRPNMFMRNRTQPPPHELTPPGDNRLLAYDIRTGLLKWESGGPSVAENLNPETAVRLDQNGQPRVESRRLGGAFFLGAPLPVDGQLLTLAEDHGQIRLFSISPETGEAQWSLALLNPDGGIAYDETRRMYGLSPAYAGGVLICPTGEGVVVAVDPLLRRVEWVQQFQQSQIPGDPRAIAMMQFRNQRIGNDAPLERFIRERRWVDSTPVMTAGRVLLPAAESNQLICLDIETGKIHWEMPRGEGLFIAACTERLCLIAGDRGMQAVRLSDGKVAWSRETPTPAGRGVVCGSQYLLPVTTSEILAIDMKSGRILARTGVGADRRAGSLVSSGGQLLMQTTSEVIGLKPLSDITSEIAREMNVPETRARALAEQGEILLFQGREPEGVKLLQESLQLQESPATRRLLVWSLLDRLKADFSASRPLLADLKRTVTDPEQRRLLNRLSAEGLEKSGESLAAFREYLDLIQDIDRSDDLVEVAFDLHVREDRWLRGRLTQLLALADEPLRQQMKAAMNEFIAAQQPAQKVQFASVLGIDLVPQLHLELALTNRFDLFIGQRVLWALSESSDPQLRGPALARILRNELSQQRKTFVAPVVVALKSDLAQVECEPGKTGAALLEQFRNDDKFGPLLEQLERPVTLPTMTVGSAGGALQQREVFPVLGSRRGPFADWLFTAELNPNQFAQCHDAQGVIRRTLNLDALGDRNLGPIRYVQTDTQLVLLAFRDRFTVISLMDADGSQNQFQTKFQSTFAPASTDYRKKTPEAKPGVRDMVYPNSSNSYYGNVGPLTYDTLCYVSGDELFAVLPHLKDRKIQWKRSGVSPGTEICADSEYVILIPPLLDRLIVLRAADGTQLAERPLPKGRVDRQRADWGRLFLVQRPVPAEGASPEQMTWAMYDPVTDKDAWSLTLPANTRWAPVDGSDLAFMEPSGTLRLVDDLTGKQLWTTPLPAQSTPPKEFTVHADSQRLYIHTASERRVDQDQITESVAPTRGKSVRVNGLAVAIDRREGQVLWSRPVEQLMFRPDLPVGSGLLAYSAQRLREKPDQKKETYTQIELLSRETGELVLEKKDSLLPPNDGWARPSAGVMLMRVSGRDFRLTWKDADESQPAAPEQNEPVPDEKPDVPIKLQ